ncbi:MAG: hypothetical protein LBR93_07090 [Treponema sp.]|nr:hypothetical protein [Treponema sp.]
MAFIIVGMIQFARQGGFTRQVGNMQVSGRYKTGKETAGLGEFPITGNLSVFFGGLEFRLAGDENRGGFLSAGSAPQGAALPEYMVISGNTVIFKLSGGGELNFTSLAGGDYAELRIEGNFPPDVEGFLLSYKPLKTSRVLDGENGLPVIIANGQSYSFDRFVWEQEPGLLFLESEGAPVSYREVPEKTVFNPEDYTLREALGRQSYDDALRSWRDRQYSLWARLVQGRNDEDLVVAFLGEAVGRGTYQNAKTLISSAFLNGNRRGYGSSLYLGGIGRTYSALNTADRERLSRLSRLIDEGSPEILGEDHVFEYLSIRAPGLVNRAAALVRDIDPAALSPELVPGIFEGFSEVKQHRPQGENPFGDLPEQTCILISRQLTRVSGVWNSGQGLVLVFRDGIADTEFNLRLGKALAVWAETAGNAAWAAVGRTLILSVLSLADEEGIPARLSLDESAPAEEEIGRLDSVRLYRGLQSSEYYPPPEYYPRIAGLGIDGIWLWTSSPSVSAVRENQILDISISFPVEETHYLMVWGVRPFNRIQLHGMDWRSDPRYESYDSSGWVYYPQDQLLVLKLKHRIQVEQVRIFYD